ncbi:MAG: hypothetical protein ACK55Z_23825, partial [bacterium]
TCAPRKTGERGTQPVSPFCPVQLLSVCGECTVVHALDVVSLCCRDDPGPVFRLFRPPQLGPGPGEGGGHHPQRERREEGDLRGPAGPP